jgi:hypothetical protein
MDVLPDPGSPMEILMLVLWRMRQQIEFQKSRSVITALLNQQGAEAKYIEQAYDDLRESFFPFEKGEKEEEIATLKKVMQKELSRGPLSVKPMVDLTRDKMKKKLAKGERIMKEKADRLKKGTLKTLDKDPFAQARARRRSASLTTKGSAVKPVRLSHPTPKSPA